MTRRVAYYRTPTAKAVKRHLKHLSDLKNPAAIGSSIKLAPEPVIRRICEAALNVLKGDLTLTPYQRRTFKRHRSLINALVNKSKPINAKRTLLVQRGGSILLGVLLPLVLSTLGSIIFGKK